MRTVLFAVCACVAAAQPTVHLVGAAETDGHRVRLTPARLHAVGAAWLAEKKPVIAGFDTEFQFKLTQRGGLGGGADGFAFVLQNRGSDAIGEPGGAGGFALGDGFYGNPPRPGIPNSIAVFFDTYRNGGADPSDNYIAICTNGAIRDMRWPPRRLGTATRLKTRMKDGQTHNVRILYQRPVLSIFLDNLSAPVLTAAVDLSTVVDPAGRSWVGFTASTGNGYENHDILNWSFRTPDVASDLSTVSSAISYELMECMPGRNLCTPEQAIVEETAPGEYHIILPAHREWGASIPARGEVEIVDPRGIVCWDLERQGAAGCTGPSGTGAGSLISRTKDGKVYFSVNDREFKDNQGYFEFNVKVR